jgi:hypothetical protein
MKKVTVLGTKPKNTFFPIISWGIRLLEHSKQSHVTFFFEEEGIVRHAYFNDIQEQKIEDFLKTNTVVREHTLYIKEDAYERLSNYTKSKLGEQSGYFCTLFGCAFPLIVRQITGRHLRNVLFKGQTCSEFVRAGFRQINEIYVFVLTNNIPSGTFTTTDALDLAEEFAKDLNKLS